MLWRAVEKCKSHESGGRVNIYCIALDKRGRVVAEAGNSYIRTHPSMRKAGMMVGVRHKEFLHAEAATLIKCRGAEIATLVIARVDKEGKEGLAKPCIVCQTLIKLYEEQQGNRIDIVYTKGEFK